MQHHESSTPKESIKKKTEEELHAAMHEAKQIIETLISKEEHSIKRFRLHHKVMFAFVVFFAVNLLWYGMWSIVSDIPILNNPIVALISGAIILIGTGYFYENSVSSDFNKKNKPHAKKKNLTSSKDQAPH